MSCPARVTGLARPWGSRPRLGPGGTVPSSLRGAGPLRSSARPPPPSGTLHPSACSLGRRLQTPLLRTPVLVLPQVPIHPGRYQRPHCPLPNYQLALPIANRLTGLPGSVSDCPPDPVNGPAASRRLPTIPLPFRGRRRRRRRPPSLRPQKTPSASAANPSQDRSFGYLLAQSSIWAEGVGLG